jgi:hypothetical protein
MWRSVLMAALHGAELVEAGYVIHDLREHFC